MTNIIIDILNSTGFYINKEKNFASNEKKHMFYVYKNYKSISEFKRNIYDDQDYLYDYISSLPNANEIKKNTSFIISIKLNENDEKNEIQEEILDLEEDKYFFKKYIITYLNSEISSFYEKLKKYNNIIEFICKNLNDTNKFEDFKVNDEVSYYSLILKLYIKIPHLTCKNIFNQKNIINLKENIIMSIQNLNPKLEDYHKRIIDLNEDEFDIYIERILDEIKVCD